MIIDDDDDDDAVLVPTVAIVYRFGKVVVG